MKDEVKIEEGQNAEEEIGYGMRIYGSRNEMEV
jgi:hypothetical protein